MVTWLRLPGERVAWQGSVLCAAVLVLPARQGYSVELSGCVPSNPEFARAMDALRASRTFRFAWERRLHHEGTLTYSNLAEGVVEFPNKAHFVQTVNIGETTSRVEVVRVNDDEYARAEGEEDWSLVREEAPGSGSDVVAWVCRLLQAADNVSSAGTSLAEGDFSDRWEAVLSTWEDFPWKVARAKLTVFVQQKTGVPKRVVVEIEGKDDKGDSLKFRSSATFGGFGEAVRIPVPGVGRASEQSPQEASRTTASREHAAEAKPILASRALVTQDRHPLHEEQCICVFPTALSFPRLPATEAEGPSATPREQGPRLTVDSSAPK